jgi:hypothetical protein
LLPNSAVEADVATQLNASRYADSELRKEVVDRDLNVPGNLPHERRRDVSTLVKRDCRAAPIGMTELLVRAPLTNCFVSTPIT